MNIGSFREKSRQNFFSDNKKDLTHFHSTFILRRTEGEQPGANRHRSRCQHGNPGFWIHWLIEAAGVYLHRGTLC
jgi:hypothetical protein